MKRAIYALTAVMLLSAVSVYAQPKIDESGTLSKLEKLEAASRDSKKAERIGTWTDLGKAYIDAANIYNTGLFYSMAQTALETAYGAPQQKSNVTIGDATFTKFVYPTVDVYLNKGAVEFWLPKKELVPDALQKAVTAYSKAFALDSSPKAAIIISQGLINAADAYKQKGANYFAAQEYDNASKNFIAAFETQAMPPVSMYDSATLFNAGFIAAVAADNAKAEKYLSDLIAKGYYRDGETYFYLIHAYLADKNIEKAKEVSKEAIAKFPTTLSIVDVVTNVYVEAGEDASSILPLIRKAVADDPNNAEMRAGLGRVLDKLGDFDGAIAEFEKAISLDPNNFAFNFNLGLMIIKKADSLSEELNTTSQAEYNKKRESIYALYEKALTPLEKAHQINPKDKNTVEFLKSLNFRLRDVKPEYMQNYEKYDALLKTM